MPSYILVKAQDGWNPDDPMVYQSGYPVHVRDFSQILGKQVPPKFIQVELTDEDDWQNMEAIYCSMWKKLIDWEFVGHDYVIDGHRLRVFMKPEWVSVSGLNSLTRDQVETFLNNWGASVVSVSQNEVIFDAVVFNAIKSNGFWNADVSLIVWDEKSYNQTTGVHRIEANYSASPFVNLPEDEIEQRITDRGGVINNHASNKVTFSINRSEVFSEFKEDVKEHVESGDFARRRFKLTAADVQDALDNAGTISMTLTEFAGRVYNRLDD